MRTQILSPAIPLLLASSPTHADWTRFRGPNGAGFDAGTQPPTVWSETQNVQWKTALPGPGTSSPIVVGERVFVTCYSGYGDGGRSGDPAKLERELVCVNRGDGKIPWSSAVPA